MQIISDAMLPNITFAIKSMPLGTEYMYNHTIF